MTCLLCEVAEAMLYKIERKAAPLSCACGRHTHLLVDGQCQRCKRGENT